MNYASHTTLCTPTSTLHTPHSTLHTPHSTLHTPHSTLHTPHSTLHPTITTRRHTTLWPVTPSLYHQRRVLRFRRVHRRVCPTCRPDSIDFWDGQAADVNVRPAITVIYSGGTLQTSNSPSVSATPPKGNKSPSSSASPSESVEPTPTTTATSTRTATATSTRTATRSGSASATASASESASPSALLALQGFSHKSTAGDGSGSSGGGSSAAGIAVGVVAGVVVLAVVATVAARRHRQRRAAKGTALTHNNSDKAAALADDSGEKRHGASAQLPSTPARVNDQTPSRDGTPAGSGDYCINIDDSTSDAAALIAASDSRTPTAVRRRNPLQWLVQLKQRLAHASASGSVDTVDSATTGILITPRVLSDSLEATAIVTSRGDAAHSRGMDALRSSPMAEPAPVQRLAAAASADSRESSVNGVATAQGHDVTQRHRASAADAGSASASGQAQTSAMPPSNDGNHDGGGNSKRLPAVPVWQSLSVLDAVSRDASGTAARKSHGQQLQRKEGGNADTTPLSESESSESSDDSVGDESQSKRSPYRRTADPWQTARRFIDGSKESLQAAMRGELLQSVAVASALSHADTGMSSGRRSPRGTAALRRPLTSRRSLSPRGGTETTAVAAKVAETSVTGNTASGSDHAGSGPNGATTAGAARGVGIDTTGSADAPPARAAPHHRLASTPGHFARVQLPPDHAATGMAVSGPGPSVEYDSESDDCDPWMGIVAIPSSRGRAISPRAGRSSPRTLAERQYRSVSPRGSMASVSLGARQGRPSHAFPGAMPVAMQTTDGPGPGFVVYAAQPSWYL